MIRTKYNTEEERKAGRLAASKRWYANNKEKALEHSRNKRKKNPELYREIAQRYDKSEKRKEWKIKNKEHTAEYCRKRWVEKYKNEKPHLKIYGMTIDDYNRMFDEQEGKCMICKSHQSELKKNLCVDHCHTTGKVRGLLCDQCNRILGQISENTITLHNMIKYLEK